MNENLLTTPKRLHVNREQEKALFKRIIQGDTSAHFLFIQAEGGMGKSALLEEFKEVCKDLPMASVNFKSVGSNVTAILGELCSQLGSRHFSTFRERRGEYARSGGIDVRFNGSYHHHSPTEITLGQSDPGQRREQEQILTDIFVEELLTLMSVQNPIVLFFDTYERATESHKEWLCNQFLQRLRPHKQIVIILAGRRIPDFDRDMNDWYLRHTLPKLERQHVKELAERFELSLGDETINIIYAGTDGRPLEIRTFLENLLRSRSGAAHG